MSNFMKVVAECQAATGTGSKATIMSVLATADDTACYLINEALDPFRTFGIKKIEMPFVYPTITTDDAYHYFFDILNKLHLRELTGNAARDAVTTALSKFAHDEQQFIVRVLDKDLKGGFSADTFNKVMKTLHGHNAILIPTFDVMLADKCEDTDDFEKHVSFPCQADFKYDGTRSIAKVNELGVIYYSRTGKETTHINGLFDDELMAVHNLVGYDFVLDGECISDLGFTDTINAKKEGNDAAKENLRFRAFFIMSLSDWLEQKTEITMRESRTKLEILMSTLNLQKIILTEGREVNDYKDMMTFCNEAIDKPENAARKIEGLILKDWNSVYTWDRSFAWTKVKRFFDIDARIVGFYAGKPKSRLANTVGGVNCVGFLESGERVEFNVGSGFSDADREHMRTNPDIWLSKTHVIKYQEVSRTKSKPVASLRFCTYQHTRDDKLVEI